MSQEYDAIVIGSGMGGGTIAYALAKSGLKTLLLERGQRYEDKEAFQDEWRMLIRMEPYENRTIHVNGKSQRLYIGGILGGGTSLYGAALLRPSRDDFTPGKFYGQKIPKAIWEWPILYDELAPYYDQAEELYHVAGDKPEKMLFVQTPENGYKYPAPSFEPINRGIAKAIRDSGYSPFHLPLGINFSKCLRCPTCPGYLCPNASRASSVNRAIDPAMKEYGLEVRSGMDAVKLDHSNGHIKNVTVLNNKTGKIEEHTAKRYIVSAGAIGSTTILKQSGISDNSRQLGRNYMYHAGAIAVGLFRKPVGTADTFIKQIGFTDLYYGTMEFTHKLGYVQELPVPGPLALADNAPVPVPGPLAQYLYERAVPLTGTVEDLPHPSNRVEVGSGGTISLHHKFLPYDTFRSKFFVGKLKKILYHAGAAFVIGATGDQDDTHTAHQVGTARFGDDPDTSVLDPECRLHGSDNLFVVDGSFMPTSLGVGPALTIAANALRVADVIKGELG